jgi:sarcosine oxidase delta subunit
MGLTDRSRLGGIKSRQQRLQRKLEKIELKPQSTSTSASENTSVSDNSSAQKEAWEKYMFAKAIYEETRDMEHWLYMQKCISEYEKTLKSKVNIKA